MFTKIGRYEIKGEIGRGGTAVVYLAHDPQLNREVAVKVMSKRLMDSEEFRHRFEREKRLLANLEHRAIVHLNEAGEIDGQPYMVMQWMPGGDLATRLKSGALSLKETSRILQRISAGLDFAHQNNIVHRDIKPSNILFDREGKAYLSDFGVAKLIQDSSTFGTAKTTKGGLVMGTLHYISPEQLQDDRPIDGRCDIYALGILLFEALTGRLPYNARTQWEWIQAHTTKPLPPITPYNLVLPPALDDILGKATAKNPEHRYATAGELADAIIAIQDDVHTPPPQKKRGATLIVEPKTPTYETPVQETDPSDKSPLLIGMSEAQGNRPRMEDCSGSCYLADVDLTVAVVADGLGPHGELAAQITVNTILWEVKRFAYRYLERMPTLLETVVKRANTAVLRATYQDIQNEGMGATAAVVAIRQNKLYLANVGDSRVYLMRQHRLIQLTRDHNWANFMVQTGQLSPEVAWNNPNAYKLMRSVGDQPGIPVDLGLYLPETQSEAEAGQNQGFPLQKDDRIVVCSNGLIKPRHPDSHRPYVSNPEIVRAILRYEPPIAAEQLVKTAVARQADDNISLIILEMPGSQRGSWWVNLGLAFQQLTNRIG